MKGSLITMKKTATNRIVTAILSIVLILGLAVPASAAKANAFTDTPDWCADAANWAAEQGIASGVGNGKFAPSEPCTNAQIITMLWRAAGKPSATKTWPGTVASYYKDAMDWAYSQGMIGANANGDQTCKRAGAALLIWEAFGSPSASTSTGFSDVASSASYAKAVTWAYTNGIVAGTGNGKFSPNESCTRGQIVTMLHRAYVPSVRLNADNGNGNTSTPSTSNTDTSAAEKTLSSYGTVTTLVKSVSNPTAANTSNKKTTSYGTVDWSTAAQGYITFTASGAERVFVIQTPGGVNSTFGVAKGSTIKVALIEGAGTYQYIIGHYTDDKSAYYVDSKDSIAIGKIDSALAPGLVSTPYADYANAPNAVAKAKELYDSSKTQLQNVQAMAKYVGGLKYDMSLKQGNVAVYVNPDTVIANGGGVCAEMSTLLAAMLRSQGIPAYRQSGTNANGNAHAWVMAWVELSSYTQNGTTYSKGAWVLVEATSGTVKTASVAEKNYTPGNNAN